MTDTSKESKDYGRASEAVSEGADARVAVTTVDIAGAREAIIEAEQRFNECVAAKDWGEACGHAVDGFGAGKIALNAVLAATRAEASSQATTTRDPKPNTPNTQADQLLRELVEEIEEAGRRGYDTDFVSSGYANAKVYLYGKDGE